MEDYEKDGKIKSFLVKGDTTPIKDKLKDAGGSWNRSLSGWIFPKSLEITVAEIIKNINSKRSLHPHQPCAWLRHTPYLYGTNFKSDM